MQKPQKEFLLEQLNILKANHEDICNFLISGEIEDVLKTLVSCQEKAIALGEVIEKFEGEDCPCIKKLEGYCELLYNIHVSLSDGKTPNPDEIKGKLLNAFGDIKTGFENDIKVKKEAVFLPYKASMWDSLESIWKKYDADPEWDAYVIPIPYFELNPEGQVSKRVYEGASFPKDVPVVSFKEYDFETRRPDEIYIINPYDDRGFVTTVDPFFYTTNLKNFTDCLVYVPYFVLAEPNYNDATYMENLKGFVLLPGVTNSNKVIVQSEKMREAYIKILVDKFGEKSKEIWEKRIFGTGSPKIEKILNAKISDYEIPADWEKKIVKPDGTRKKIVLYNTSLGAFLDNSELMVKKIKSAIEIFKENKDEITLLWRPHPLLISTISSMHPELLDEYVEIVNKYKSDDFGIYDDSSDMDRALVLSDAYYGDSSSLVELYKKTGKPIMLQNVYVNKQEKQMTVWGPDFCVANEKVWLIHEKLNALFSLNLKNGQIKAEATVPTEPQWGKTLFNGVFEYGGSIILMPQEAKEVVVYNTFDKSIKTIKKLNNTLYNHSIRIGTSIYSVPMLINTSFLKYDILEGTLTEEKIFEESLVNQLVESTYESVYMHDICKTDGSAICGVFYINNDYYVYDTVSRKVDIVSVEDSDAFSSISFLNGYLYLYDYKKKEVVKVRIGNSKPCGRYKLDNTVSILGNIKDKILIDETRRQFTYCMDEGMSIITEVKVNDEKRIPREDYYGYYHGILKNQDGKIFYLCRGNNRLFELEESCNVKNEYRMVTDRADTFGILQGDNVIDDNLLTIETSMIQLSDLMKAIIK